MFRKAFNGRSSPKSFPTFCILLGPAVLSNHAGSVETTTTRWPASLIEWEDPCHRGRNEEGDVERPLIYGHTH